MQKLTYSEFEKTYKSFHTCGIPYIPYDLAYSSDCPRCAPDSPQWKEECKKDFEAGRTARKDGFWVKE